MSDSQGLSGICSWTGGLAFTYRARGNQIKSSSKLSLDNVVGSWEEPQNICMTVAKNACVG